MIFPSLPGFRGESGGINPSRAITPGAMRKALMFIDAKRTALGHELTPADQKCVLAQYVHRYTRDHVPQWVKKYGEPMPIQFDSDQDWLKHTRFAVQRNGRLDHSFTECQSSPTWPDNPELREGTIRAVLPAEAKTKALREFVETINNTGGIVTHQDGTHGTKEDPDWIDLGTAYLSACAALDVAPLISPAEGEA